MKVSDDDIRNMKDKIRNFEKENWKNEDQKMWRLKKYNRELRKLRVFKKLGLDYTY